MGAILNFLKARRYGGGKAVSVGFRELDVVKKLDRALIRLRLQHEFRIAAPGLRRNRRPLGIEKALALPRKEKFKRVDACAGSQPLRFPFRFLFRFPFRCVERVLELRDARLSG